MKNKVYAVLLAGGKGTRLWPLSTEGCSKSFVRIGKNAPAIAKAIGFLKGFIPKKNIIIVSKPVISTFTQFISPTPRIDQRNP